MKLESEKGARCCECGAEQKQLIRMEGGLYCFRCLMTALDMLFNAGMPPTVVIGPFGQDLRG